MRLPASASELLKQVLLRTRGNPHALGGIVAGLLALLLVVFAATFSWAVNRGLSATTDVVNTIQVSDRLRALSPELTKAEAHLQLLSHGHAVSTGMLEVQLRRVDDELNALEPVVVTFPPQPWAVFRQLQEDWAAIQAQAASLKRASVIDLAAQGIGASEIFMQRFASMRGRSSALDSYLRLHQDKQRQRVLRWQRGMQSMAWGLLASVFLLAGLSAWLVGWIWANSVREFTWSAERLAAGDFSQRITVPQQGNLRGLAQAVNAIADQAQPSGSKPRAAAPAAPLEESLEQVDQQV